MSSIQQSTETTVSLQIAAKYLAYAIETMIADDSMRPLNVDTTITDANGTHTVFHINLDPQDAEHGDMVVSSNLDDLTDDELLLLAGNALALYNAVTETFDDSSNEENEQ
jgi:hypothetical protein|nr:MAG TPA: hypothetical protein [Caudoviricetes sp.]